MTISVINGANLNFLGIREPSVYGTVSYETLCETIRSYADQNDLCVEVFQSNHEGDLIDRIQSCYGRVDGIVINPGGFTHTSVALLDALKAVSIPSVEVHLTDLSQREPFRRISLIREACEKTVMGQGIEGYLTALSYLKERLS